MNSVYLYLHAGLCNQLFMIFATISYSLDNNLKYYFYSKSDKTIDNGNPIYWDNLLNSFKNNITDKILVYIPLYEEPYFHYKEIPKYNYDLNIKGYFQSEKYFKHNYNKIIDIIGLREKQKNIKDKYIHLFDKKTIAIHFRIGDYIGLQYNHPIAPIQYYINSIKYLINNIKDIDDYNILYFCQKKDNEVVNKYINKLPKLNYIKVDDDIEDYNQLLLMSLCDNFIIGNSTFSWFGAYFSKNINKIVLYPYIWFGPALSHNITDDICPKEWIKIDYKDDGIILQ